MESKKIHNPFKEYYPTRKEAREMFQSQSLVTEEDRELYQLSDGSVFNARTDTVIEMIPLLKAAEVLAKWIHKDEAATYWSARTYEELEDSEKQQYLDRALEELKK